MAEAKVLSEATFDEAVASGVTLVDFGATWCGPCKVLGELIAQQVMPELGDSAAFATVDVGDEPGLAARFEVFSVPALIVFKDGEEFARLEGFQKPDAVLAAVRGAL